MASPQLRKLIKPLDLPRNRADFVASIARMEGGDIDDLVDRLGALADQDLAGVAIDAIDSDINDPTVGLMELADLMYGPEQAPAKTGIRGKTGAPPEKIESNLPDSKADKDTLPATPKEQGSGKKGAMDADTKYLKDKGFGPDYEWDSPEQRADTLASLREQDAQKGKGGKKSAPKTAETPARSPEMQRAMQMAEQARGGMAAPDDPSIVMAGGMPGYEDVVMPTPADMGATMMDAGDFEAMYNVSPYSPPPPTPEEIERHRMAQMFNRMGDPRYQYRPEAPAPNRPPDPLAGITPEDYQSVFGGGPKPQPADPFVGLSPEDIQSVFGGGPSPQANDPFAGLSPEDIQSVFGGGEVPRGPDDIKGASVQDWQDVFGGGPSGTAGDTGGGGKTQPGKPEPWSPVTSRAPEFLRSMGSDWVTKPIDHGIRNLIPYSIAGAGLGAGIAAMRGAGPTPLPPDQLDAIEQERMNARAAAESVLGPMAIPMPTGMAPGEPVEPFVPTARRRMQ